MKYTIQYNRFENQDNQNFYDFTTREQWEADHGNWYDFDEILANSETASNGVKSVSDIKSFCDGYGSCEPYFSTETARDEWENVLSGYDLEGVDLDETNNVDVSGLSSTGY